MMTLAQFSRGLASVPTATAWSLAHLGQAMGRQELFTRQSPQRLKVLREYALIESAVSSNRIEGVEVDQKRIGTLMFGKPPLILSDLISRTNIDGLTNSFIKPPPRQLRLVWPKGQAEPSRPDSPLAAGSLFTGTRLDPSLVSQLRKELETADS